MRKQSQTPLRVACASTPSVSTDFLRESHRIGHGGVLEGVGEVIAGEGDQPEGENKSALLGGERS